MKNLPEIFRSFLALSSQNNLRLMKARKGQNCLRLFHRMTSRRLASVISYNRLPNSDQQSVTYNDQLVRIKTPFDRIDNTDHISSTSSVLIDTICPKLYRPKCISSPCSSKQNSLSRRLVIVFFDHSNDHSDTYIFVQSAAISCSVILIIFICVL